MGITARKNTDEGGDREHLGSTDNPADGFADCPASDEAAPKKKEPSRSDAFPPLRCRSMPRSSLTSVPVT